MREGRLLERIFQKGMNPGAKMTYETGKVVESVINHLQCLLNTREGCTMIDKDLGMADISEIVAEYPATLDYIKKTIKNIIAKYEHRIEHVNVAFVEKDDVKHVLHFSITGVLSRAGRVTPIILESKFNPDGYMQVKR
jgi:type VI secretion system protein